MKEIKDIIGTILLESKDEKHALKKLRKEISKRTPSTEVFLLDLGLLLANRFHDQLLHQLRICEVWGRTEEKE